MKADAPKRKIFNDAVAACSPRGSRQLPAAVWRCWISMR